MSKKNRLPKEVLEELAANPNISEEMLEAARRATIRDEGWDRLDGNKTNTEAPESIDPADIKFPEVIDLGLTIGDIVDILSGGEKSKCKNQGPGRGSGAAS